MARAATAVHDRPAVDFLQIPVDSIAESPLNPRKHFDQAKLEELSASILEKGIIEPLIVRTATDGRYEIVAGARRFRAAQLARLFDVPCLVRDLTDTQLLEIAIVENEQREDVNPLEQAEGYAALMSQDRAYTVEAIAAKLGVHRTTVQRRLRLLRLIDVPRAALMAGAITAAHAERLAKLTPELQLEGVRHCFSDLLVFEDDGRDIDQLVTDCAWTQLAPALRSIGELEEWAQQHTKADLQDAAVREALAPLLDYDEGVTVEDGEVSAADDPIATLLQLSENDAFDFSRKHAKAMGVVHRDDWEEIDAGAKPCPFTLRGVIVHGGALRVLDVCASKKCTKHRPERQAPSTGSSGPKVDYPAQQRKEDEKRKAEQAGWDALKPHALKAFAGHVAKLKLTTDLVAHVVGHYELKRIADTFKVKLTPATIPQVLALRTLINMDYSRSRFLESVKPFKFDLKKVEAQLAKAQKAAPVSGIDAVVLRALDGTAGGLGRVRAAVAKIRDNAELDQVIRRELGEGGYMGDDCAYETRNGQLHISKPAKRKLTLGEIRNTARRLLAKGKK